MLPEYVHRWLSLTLRELRRGERWVRPRSWSSRRSSRWSGCWPWCWWWSWGWRWWWLLALKMIMIMIRVQFNNVFEFLTKTSSLGCGDQPEVPGGCRREGEPTWGKFSSNWTKNWYSRAKISQRDQSKSHVNWKIVVGQLQGADQDSDGQAEASRGKGWVCWEVCPETAERGENALIMWSWWGW